MEGWLDAALAEFMSVYATPVRVGLTGDIGSGKSTALAIFEEEGWVVLSTDQVVHQLLSGDDEVIDSLRKRFGDAVFLESGEICRQKLGRIVFGHPEQRVWLENLLHPRVRRVWTALVEGEQKRPVVVEIPLLFEKRLENHFQHCVTIFCSFEEKLRRLQNRGFGADASVKRLETQLPQAEKANRSDFLILNNGSLQFLKSQVKYCIASMLNPTAGLR